MDDTTKKDIFQTIDPAADAGMGAVLNHLSIYGSSGLGSLLRLRHGPTNIYVVDTTEDDPRNFINESFHGSVNVYDNQPITGLRLSQFPDQAFLEKFVYPVCSHLKNEGTPLAHFIRTRIDKREAQYRRLIAPVPEPEGKLQFLAMSWIDYSIETDMSAEILSPAQKKCLLFLANGYPAKSIAFAMGLTTGTVEHHIEAAKVKLGARNTTHAVAIALLNRLLDVPNR